ncbi:hypothetical protein ACFSJU_10790 [Paradesertivirga mongoliensis]|uniref:Uncharacterized protein n=1 Tax=Paradesertivirga mongoliensis TaxID=2100740 RepID=A0ABW4ZMT1_9SPHI|nr:hypothetical protein [Pedobacter mongoliensis]
METPDSNNRKIKSAEDELREKNADAQERRKPADDGFKTGKKTHGLTWEAPMDEQAFDEGGLSRNPADEEAD